MQEQNLESKLVKKIEAIGGLALKFNSSKRGMPDRIILMPGGRCMFIEMKAPGEIPKPLQQKRIKDFRKLGFKVAVIDSDERIEAFIKEVNL